MHSRFLPFPSAVLSFLPPVRTPASHTYRRLSCHRYACPIPPSARSGPPHPPYHLSPLPCHSTPSPLSPTPESPTRCLSRTPSLPHLVYTLVICPWRGRGVGQPQIAAPNPHAPPTRPRRLVPAEASLLTCMSVFLSPRRYNPSWRRDGGDDAMTPPLSLPLAAGAATSGVVSRVRVAVTPSGGGCGGDHSGASCDDDDGGEARGGRARHCRRRRRHRRRPCRSPVAKD